MGEQINLDLTYSVSVLLVGTGSFLVLCNLCFVEKDCFFKVLYYVVLLQVLFNLANQYAANEMYAEALNTYQVIVKNKMFSNAGLVSSLGQSSVLCVLQK